ncbi:ATP/GTP-binding protein [Cryptosporangium sp. NPDC048952]|uniref:AAA family ATPase n=1 Tax=Cryptosporangium sp. NPDC048952 TaxID=3363961 RepID=UPI003716CFAA
MLRSFRFANHRSFRDEQELTLLPVYDRAQRRAVSIAAVYGANASGKSNVLDAFRFMVDAVLRSYRDWEPGGSIPRRPFRLAATSVEEPSWFAVDLVADDVRYEYGFGLDDERVIEEWLHAYPQRKRRVLFTRIGDDITFGPSVQGPKAALPELTRPGALLLTVAAHTGVESLIAVYEWFRETVRVVDLSYGAPRLPSADDYRRTAADHPARIHRLINLMQAADLGISGVQLPKSPETPASNSAEAVDKTPILRLSPGSGKTRVFYELLNASEQLQKYGDYLREDQIQLVHGKTAFPLADESAGTRGWLALLWTVLPVLEDGGVLVVDELDSRLHPLLTARLLRLFHSTDTNAHEAQLVFAAHDTSLLGTSLSHETLLRDEVWFVEKDADGASKLFPLSQFKPRHGENPERRYLGGSYGAVPFLDADDFDGAPGGPVPA